MAGSWTHMVVTWNNSAMVMEYYVDGVCIGTQPLAYPITSIYTLRVGNYGVDDSSNFMANQFDGKLYDLQVYDFVLSDSDIKFLTANPGDLLVPAQ